MIKAIIFDFDGVLVESAGLKTEAFRKLFSAWPDKVDEIVSYHCKNMGISRFVKFRYFYENILGESYSEETGQRLSERFSEIVVDEIKRAPLVMGTHDFLRKNFGRYLFFIASGTPQDELIDIVTSMGLTGYFRGVFGTLATKPEITISILHEYNLNRDEVVFVGDAESDHRAAEKTGIHFVLRVMPENNEVLPLCTHRISDLTELGSVIIELGGEGIVVD